MLPPWSMIDMLARSLGPAESSARGRRRMEFKAAVLDRVGAPLESRKVKAAPLGPFDVGVRIRASGLCHTDLEAILGSVASRMPVVLGHEGAGVVEAVGAAVTKVKPGDHVICSWNPHCRPCFSFEQDVPILFDRHIRAHRDGPT